MDVLKFPPLSYNYAVVFDLFFPKTKNSSSLISGELRARKRPRGSCEPRLALLFEFRKTKGADAERAGGVLGFVTII